MVVRSRRTGERVGIVAENALVWGGACVAVPGEGADGAGVGCTIGWGYVFVGAVRGAIVPGEGMISRKIREVRVNNCDGGNFRTILSRHNLMPMFSPT